MIRKATLGLVIEHDSVAKATTELDRMGATGEVSQKRVQSALSATERQLKSITTSMQRMREASAANAMESMVRASDPFQRSMTKVGEAAEHSHLAIGRVNMALEGLATEAVGANSKLASIAAKFAEFGVGGLVTGGILAGLAALAFAWEKLGENSAKATEELKKQLDVLRDIKKEQDEGVGGPAGAAVKAGRARLARLAIGINSDQRQLDNGQLQGQSIAFVMQERDRFVKEYVDIALLVQAGEKKVAQNEAVEFDRRWQDRLDFTNKIIAQMKATEDTLTRIQREGAERRQRISDMTEFGIAPGKGDITQAMQNTAIGVAMRNQQIGQNVFDNLATFGKDAKDKLTEALKNLKIIQEVTDDEAKKAAIKLQALNAAFGLASQIGGGVGFLGSLVQGGLSGSAGGPWGVAVGAVSALASGILSLGKSSQQAAQQIAAMKQSVQNYLLGVAAANGSPGAQLQLQINQAKADADAAKAALQAAYPEQYYYDAHGGAHGMGRGTAYTQALLQIDIAEAKRIENLKAEAKLLEESKIKDAIAALDGVLSTLQDFKNSIALSSLSPLSPVQKLAAARQQYEDILTKAKTGDQSAANQLPSFAQAFLQVSRSVYASGGGYQRDYAQVMKDTDDVMKLFQDAKDIQQKQLDILLGIQTGSAAAANQAHEDTGSIIDAIGSVADAITRLTEGDAGQPVFAT